MSGWSDAEFDAALAGVLRAGVLFAASVVLVGAGIYLTRHGLDRPSYRAFVGEPAAWQSVGGVLHGARTFDGGGVIQLGVLLLIATPIARVVLSVFGFLRQRDWLYVAITSLVLLLLAYSLMSA